MFEKGMRKNMNMGQKWSRNETPNRVTTHKKRCPKSIRKKDPTSDRFLGCFFIDLASVLGAILEPCWAAFSAQNGPGGFQDASKTLPRRSQTLPKRLGWPKMAQDASKPAPEPSRPRFSCLQAWILMVFLIKC